MRIPELEKEAASRLASLIGIGAKSGDTVAGLSAVRRTRNLAYVFADDGISANTLEELGRLQRRGVEVYRVASLATLTLIFGRRDLLVIGVRKGALARGIAGRLAGR